VEPDAVQELPYVGLEHVSSWTGRLLPLDAQAISEGPATLFRPGDTLFGKLRPYLAKGCNVDFQGVCSAELLVLRAGLLDHRYLLYTLLTPGFISEVDSSTYGAKMPRANWGFVGSCRVPIPPLPEQQAIAAFLDRETGRLDLLTAKKQALIVRLREKRAALISRTVSRGLNPAAPLKPSGVEWLGEVPAGWDTQRLKYAAPRSEERVEADAGHDQPYVGLEHVSSWTGQVLALDEELSPSGTATRFSPGDTLFGKLRPYLAKACNVDFEGVCSAELLVLRACRLDRRYLLYALLTPGFIAVIDSSTYGAKMPRASWQFVGSCVVPVPPLPEQQAIAAFLDRETGRLDLLTERVETAIERLKEYRSALITAAVTGKVDVRGHAPAEVP